MSGCNILIDLLFPSASDFQFTDDTDLVAYAQFNIQHLTFKKMSNRFTSRLSDDDDFKRDELIRKIEHSVSCNLGISSALAKRIIITSIKKDG